MNPTINSQQNNQEVNPAVVAALVKAWGYNENGGQPDVSNPQTGKTGELKSIFQFEPGTWQEDSQETFGKSVPLTPDNETAVAFKMVNKWLGEGYTPEQVFSMINAGPGEPNAYTGKFSNGAPSVGTNQKYGVKFNVPAYVNHGMTYFNHFIQNEPTQSSMGPQMASNIQTPNQPIQASQQPQLKPSRSFAPKANPSISLS